MQQILSRFGHTTTIGKLDRVMKSASDFDLPLMLGAGSQSGEK
jgi:hypothetical protein